MPERAVLVRLLAGVVLLCLLLVLLWSRDGAQRADPAMPATVDRTASDVVDVASGDSAEHASIGAQPQRVAVERDAGAEIPASGGLRVRVQWTDGGPASRIPVFVRNTQVPYWQGWAVSRPSDEQGFANFERLSPGEWMVSARRGAEDGPTRVAVVALETAEVTLTLPRGLRVTGTVEDPIGVPVPGADILVARAGFGQYAVLAQSDEEGRFDLHGLEPDCAVGAHAHGFAPSPLYSLAGREGGELTVRIRFLARGGSLECMVVDATGVPVAGAVVRVGIDGEQNQPQQQPDGARIRRFPLDGLTDDEGHVSFAGVAAGEQQVAVRAVGSSPWRGSAQITEGRTEKLTIRMPALSSLAGVVRDELGAALAGLHIRAGQVGTLAEQGTQTAADGSYLLEGTPIGEFRVSLQGDVAAQYAQVVGVEGAVVRWDPVVSAIRELHGRLLGQDGGSIADAKLDVSVRGGGGGTVFTDRDGKFALSAGVGRVVRIKAHVSECPMPIELFDDIPPLHGEWILRLRTDQMPSVRLRGAIVDPDGRPVVNARLRPLQRGHGQSVEHEPDTDGRFDLGPYPPGDYAMIVRASGWASVCTPWRTLGPGGVADFGTIRLEQGGALSVQLVGEATSESAWFRLYDDQRISIGGARFVRGTGVAGGLPGGRYELQVAGAGIAAERLPVTIQAGQQTRIDVAGRRGAPVAVTIGVAGVERVPRRVDLMIVDARGRTVVELPDLSLRDDGSSTTDISLAAGMYRAQVVTKELRGEAAFEVGPSLEPARAQVLLR